MKENYKCQIIDNLQDKRVLIVVGAGSAFQSAEDHSAPSQWRDVAVVVSAGGLAFVVLGDQLLRGLFVRVLA